MSPQWLWLRDNGDMATLSVCGPLGGKRSLLSTRLISACTISVFLRPNLSRSFLSFPEQSTRVSSD